ncbi:hypothetical protein PK69_13125 [Xanthomonas phaseoli pv. phaseoli]|uniref:Transposase n=1 Tax=Xanthomonas campestris pv. phaseoli TaxID=317013 RepID=A0AB34QHA3_XANCH|nr:hypothetical protein AC609_22165 [Xanthomonas phaseoli pv. phaseoli]AZU32395.1 hypothetical protein AC801_21780 [Xanthomonas sp. ISO98C4]AZU28073.1 hypothetical protein AC611_22190 [Xanthomonas phaseoli pv. phaseoli]AZU36837.1 hypothetical protein AC610_22155 [Xanthomonas phaseoli pv. phaseoli]KGT51443.1 hypothetical protein NZ02_09200 [Xanthomonas phaseoli pv. phaseoli]
MQTPRRDFAVRWDAIRSRLHACRRNTHRRRIHGNALHAQRCAMRNAFQPVFAQAGRRSQHPYTAATRLAPGSLPLRATFFNVRIGRGFISLITDQGVTEAIAGLIGRLCADDKPAHGPAICGEARVIQRGRARRDNTVRDGRIAALRVAVMHRP